MTNQTSVLIPALLAHIRAQDEQIEKLEAVAVAAQRVLAFWEADQRRDFEDACVLLYTALLRLRGEP